MPRNSGCSPKNDGITREEDDEIRGIPTQGIALASTETIITPGGANKYHSGI